MAREKVIDEESLITRRIVLVDVPKRGHDIPAKLVVTGQVEGVRQTYVLLGSVRQLQHDVGLRYVLRIGYQGGIEEVIENHPAVIRVEQVLGGRALQDSQLGKVDGLTAAKLRRAFVEGAEMAIGHYVLPTEVGLKPTIVEEEESLWVPTRLMLMDRWKFEELPDYMRRKNG